MKIGMEVNDYRWGEPQTKLAEETVKIVSKYHRISWHVDSRSTQEPNVDACPSV